MAESVLATFDNVKFIQGETLMTQDNWQTYFKTAVPSGVYSGLELLQYDAIGPQIRVEDGVVFANGIRAELETDDGYTEIGYLSSSVARDRFVCVRVYFTSETAELVQKTNIATESSNTTTQNQYFAETMMEFLSNESYQCTRNSSYYDIPLLYQTALGFCIDYGCDLRRKTNIGRVVQTNPNYTGITQTVSNTAVLSWRDRYTYSGTDMTLYADCVDIADGAVFTITPGSGASVTVTLSMIPFCRNLIAYSASTSIVSYAPEIDFTFSGTGWTHNVAGRYFTRTLTSAKTFRITFSGVDTSGGSVVFKFAIEEFSNYASTVWGNLYGTLSDQTDLQDALDDKADADSMTSALALKANTADVDAALALKANTSDMTAALDLKANTTDMTDALALKANTADLGDLATQDTVDYETEVTNKPTLGDLASQDTVDYDTEVTNKPTLGTMASVNDAASDGKEYVRKNGAWAEVTEPTSLAWGNISGTLSDQTDLQTVLNAKANASALAEKAPLASPALTGTPTAPTAATSTNSTQIATTAYVKSNLSSYATTSALAAKAPLASPELTGTPTAPTAAAGTNSTQIATTAFVRNAIGSLSSSWTYVYVSSTGSDQYGDGSYANPYRTIATSLNSVGTNVHLIFLSTGVYNETVEIYTKDVTFWTYSGSDYSVRIYRPNDEAIIVRNNHKLEIVSGEFSFENNTSSHPAVLVKDHSTLIVEGDGLNTKKVTFSSAGHYGLHVDQDSRAYLTDFDMIRFANANGLLCTRGSSAYVNSPYVSVTGTGFNAQGSTIIYQNLASESSYGTLAAASGGGIISTGAGHIFS